MKNTPDPGRIRAFLALRTTREERRALALLGLIIALSLIGLSLFRN